MDIVDCDSVIGYIFMINAFASLVAQAEATNNRKQNGRRKMPQERAKKTLFGLGLTAAGLSLMFVSPVAGTALGLTMVGNMGSYYLFYFLGFVALLFGVGYVLIANNLWGEARR